MFSFQWRHPRSTGILAISAVLLTIPSPVFSFGTVNGPLGQMLEHERITRAALACASGAKSTGDCFEPLSITSLAGGTNAFGAVGAPDVPGFIEGATAHCDDADYFDSARYTPSAPPYPVTRGDATFALEMCTAHLQLRLDEGTTASSGLLDSKDRIIPKEVNLGTPGNENDCTFTPSMLGRAKCNAMDGLGRALHGVQDFYAHSNWVDSPISTSPFSPVNPPGLGLSGPSPLMDLRRAFSSSTFTVPNDLSTGCYDGALSDESPGVGKCKGRVTHNTLNKDKGTIDPVTGKTSSPTTPRGQIADNFNLAVQAAIAETRRQWKDFRSELEAKYGARRANLMVCALTRDDPIKDCQGRKIAIVIDSSGSNQDTDPSNLRISAAQAFNSMLVSQSQAGSDGLPDRVTVIDFDEGSRVISPLGDPSQASFDGIDSDGGTFIAGGVATAIGELTKDPQDPTADRTGMVVLTDGQDEDIGALVAELNQAESLGIRVAFGFLSPPANPVPSMKRSGKLYRRDPPPVELVTAILRTGGFFSTIDSAQAQKSFVDLVIAHGVTNIDKVQGGGPLFPGLTVTGLASAASEPDVFSYHGQAGQELKFTVQSMSNQHLKSVLRDVRGAVQLDDKSTDSQGKAVISLTLTKEVDLELVISTTDLSEGVYSVSLDVTMPCDHCPCGVNKPQCLISTVTVSTLLTQVTSFCITLPGIITTPTPTPIPPHTPTTTPTPIPPHISTTTPTPLPPHTSTTTPTPLPPHTSSTTTPLPPPISPPTTPLPPPISPPTTPLPPPISPPTTPLPPPISPSTTPLPPPISPPPTTPLPPPISPPPSTTPLPPPISPPPSTTPLPPPISPPPTTPLPITSCSSSTFIISTITTLQTTICSTTPTSVSSTWHTSRTSSTWYTSHTPNTWHTGHTPSTWHTSYTPSTGISSPTSHTSSTSTSSPTSQTLPSSSSSSKTPTIGDHLGNNGVNNAVVSDDDKGIFDPSTKSFRVFVTLICIIAAQTAAILAGVVWCCCCGRRDRGSYTTIGDDQRPTGFVPKWASWTPRHGYSKPGENTAPPGATVFNAESDDHRASVDMR